MQTYCTNLTCELRTSCDLGMQPQGEYKPVHFEPIHSNYDCYQYTPGSDSEEPTEVEW